MNRKKISLLSIIIVLIAIIFVFLGRSAKKQALPTQEISKPPVTVSVQSAANSTILTQTIQYPATVVGDQEIKITAKTAGNASQVNFNLGDHVGAGSTLAKIDDTGNTLTAGDEGLQSAQVQQSGLSVDQAAEALSLAKNNYHDLRLAYDAQKKNSSLPQTISKAQVDAAKNQVDIAHTQYTSVHIGFKSVLDNHIITSPISGIITSRSVSVGDSISQGQALFGISKTANVKIQFYVAQDQIAAITKGQVVSITDNNGNTFNAVVQNISPIADPTTKRFLIEAFPEQKPTTLFSGTIVTASFQIIQKPSNAGSLILPLAAITVGQNESHIFVAINNKAKQIPVKIEKVIGEAAQISTDIPTDAQIIISGSKLVQDGSDIQIQN